MERGEPSSPGEGGGPAGVPSAQRRLCAPEALRAWLPLGAAEASCVERGRQSIRGLLRGTDPRLVVIVGPCSIHDREAALKYATRLARVARGVGDRLIVVMRTYFEKPRTTVGWKGFIHDPGLDGGGDVAAGIRGARELVLEILRLGLPCAAELLDPLVATYIADILSWAAIGARTNESQIHRELASGLPLPIGFKNAT